ncbi:hypothetical protein GCM10022226_25860 [Sphaerisporangium flaviroseum]|uniref:Carrier domain-containing protein n=1 Tax=Sphaerisporangium flaviroseum TaxID=509199 RepID=A0ABP7I2N0_9ACTN
MSDETRGRVAGLPSQRQELVARLLAARKRPAGDAIPLVPRDSGLLECSPEQRRLWLAAQMDRQVAAPNATLGLGLSGPLDLGALAKALIGLTERHETLRTVFVNSGGEPRQMVLGSVDAPVTVVDLTGDPDGERTARRLAVAAGGEWFDLASGPLLRLTVYRLAPEEHRLLLVCGHIVCDGGSMEVVARELAALYSGRALPEPPPVRYADYAAWARARARTRGTERLAHWRERLGDEPPLFGRPPGSADTTSRAHGGAARAGDAGPRADGGATGSGGGRRTGTSVAQVEAGLIDGLRRGAATPFVAVLAALFVLLHRVTGRSGITIGTASSARTRRELEPVVGCFVNMVPVPVRLDGSEGFHEVMARTRDEVGAALANEVPFDALVSSLGGRRRPGVHPIFQVAFIQRDGPATPEGWHGLRAFEWGQEVDDSTYDLTLTMTPKGTGHELVFAHRFDRIPDEPAGSLATGFETLLTALSISPDVPVGDLAVPPLDGFPPLPVRAEAGTSGDPAEAIQKPAAPLGTGPPPGHAAGAVGPGQAGRAAGADGRLVAEIRRIWGDVLGVSGIDEHTDLFDLGGDSLAITQMAARIRDVLGVEVPAYMFFEAPTVRGFADAVMALEKAPDNDH